MGKNNTDPRKSLDDDETELGHKPFDKPLDMADEDLDPNELADAEDDEEEEPLLDYEV